ncbi:MAG TPA: CHAT domain-containing tetratricopeptide repeat protein [Stellaceae bacterium]|nr:CHAT domain-containing tetratricopeptide repeat protein [Stellaceae bacterium]
MRVVAAAVVLTAAALVAGAAGRQAAADPAAEAATLQSRAAALIQKGDYAAAGPALEQAVQLLERGTAANDAKLADALNLLADLYETQGRFGDAEPLYRRVIAIREEAPGQDRLDLAAALNGLAGLYKLEGHYAEAERLYRRTLDIVETARAPPAVGLTTILNNLALIYQKEGRQDDAEPLYRRAIEAAAATPETDRLLGPVIRNNLAGLYKEEGRYAEAEPLYAGVLQARETGQAAPLDLAASLNNLASVYDAEGKDDAARPLYQKALALREATLGADHPDVAQSLNNLAGLDMAAGRLDAAAPLLQRALAIRKKTLPPDHPEIVTALNNLAAVYWAAGRRDAALAASRDAIGALEAHIAADAGDGSAASIAEIRHSRVYFANYIGIAYGAALGHPERQAALAADTFRVVQLAQASSAAQAIAAMTARFAAGTGDLAQAIRARQDLAADLQRLDARLVAAATRPETEWASGEDAALRAQRDEARRALDGADRDLRAQHPAYAALTVPPPAVLSATQSLLAAREALLVYLVTPKEVWSWVVRRDSAMLYRADVGAGALTAAVEALRATLTPELPPYPASRAYELYQKILAPALPQLAGIDHLIVVPDGALQSLPFSILVTAPPHDEPKTPADHRTIAWLARQYAVSVLPSASSLAALRRPREDRTAAAAFLGIGDPVLGGAAATPPGPELAKLFRGANAADIRELPALPETAGELRAVAQALGASPDDLLLGAQATVTALHRLPLDRYRIVEFATHGLLSGDLAGLTEPALVLTPPAQPTSGDDGLLRASDIATLRLDADWVVLSACNTAAGEGAPDAGGWSELTRAFFYAGARSLLVSHWPVWSKATVKLITGVFDEQTKAPSIDGAEALRRAEMAMLDDANAAEFAHPLAWAPFSLAGLDRPAVPAK